jgi:hypothetical protein
MPCGQYDEGFRQSQRKLSSLQSFSPQPALAGRVGLAMIRDAG